MEYIFPPILSKDFVSGIQATAFLHLEVLPVSPPDACAPL